jgi:fucose permease
VKQYNNVDRFINVNNSRHKLIRIAFLSFIALGLRAGLLGVSWPSIRDTYSLPLDAVGAYLIAAMLGYLLTTSLSGWIITSLGLGQYLLLGSIIAGFGFLGQAAAPTWWMLVFLSFVTSTGVAAIDAGLNTYFALNQSAGEMNWLHACFGLGGTLSPMVMTIALNLSGSWRWGFIPVALVYGLLAFVFLTTRNLWPVTSNQKPSDYATPITTPGNLETLSLPVVWTGLLLFFAVTGVEGSSAQWPYTLFTESRDIAPQIASLWVTLFWASMTAGRIFFGFVVERVGRQILLRLCMAMVTLAAAVMWWNPGHVSSFIAFTVIGFCVSPIFPVTTSMTPTRVGESHAANAIGFQMAVARLGLSLIPGLVGVLANAFGLEIIPPLLFINALIMLLLQEIIVRQEKRIHRTV